MYKKTSLLLTTSLTILFLLYKSPINTMPIGFTTNYLLSEIISRNCQDKISWYLYLIDIISSLFYRMSALPSVHLKGSASYFYLLFFKTIKKPKLSGYVPFLHFLIVKSVRLYVSPFVCLLTEYISAIIPFTLLWTMIVLVFYIASLVRTNLYKQIHKSIIESVCCYLCL